jgi:hypothetical protein
LKNKVFGNIKASPWKNNDYVYGLDTAKGINNDYSAYIGAATDVAAWMSNPENASTAAMLSLYDMSTATSVDDALYKENIIKMLDESGVEVGR